MRQLTRGFTLVEVMIVVAIIALIATLAYPSYLSSVRKSNRAEAKTEIFDVAQRLQRCYTAYGKFNSGSCTVYNQLANAITSRDNGFYSITISDVTATTYTLTARAIKAPQTSDTGCEELKLTHTGAKTPAECW